MPTGYTANIKDGISFKEYALNCARAFGALVHLRDQPNAEIPDEIEPNTYHKEEIDKYKSMLKKVNMVEDEKLIEDWKELKQDVIDRGEKGIKEANKLREKYEDMLEKVNNWKAPTEDHYKFKEFMVEQIENSINADCSTDYYENLIETWENKEAPEAFTIRQERIKMYQEDIEYHEEKWKEEKQRTKNKSNWVKSLKHSLEKYDG